MKTLAIVLVVIAGISAYALFPSKEIMPSRLDEMQAFRDSAAKVIVEESSAEVTKNLVIYSQDDLVGDWVGWVESADSIYSEEMKDYYSRWFFTNLHIEKFEGNNVSGYVILNGAKKKMNGTLMQAEGMYNILISSIEDAKYSWTASISAMDSILSVRPSYSDSNDPHEFEKRLFAYSSESSTNDIEWPYIDDSNFQVLKESYIEENGDTTFYEYQAYFATTEAVFEINSSHVLLTEKEVENMKKGDIFILRNSIFARHGYIFKDEKLMNYFGYAPWYVPCQTEVAHELTDIELKNIDLLLRYEEHAEAYYDVFGR